MALGAAVLHRQQTRSRRAMTGKRIAAIGFTTAIASSAIIAAVSPGNLNDSAAARTLKANARPDPSAATTIVSQTTVPGNRVVYQWPAHGQAAVAVRGIGVIAASPRERPVPIASLTKMMTALVILKDHPLTARARGPLLVVDATDVADYDNDVASGDSTLKVALGERLDEHQLLEALLLPSGDNIADLLARWDAGSLLAFVAKMNAEVRELGLTQTHYADASGVSRGSVSTAADQTVVESALMAYPAARLIVRMRQARLPVAGLIPNFNPAIGVDGIVGVKSGWTQEAGACLATAAYRQVGNKTVLVESVTLGQLGDLRAPALVDESLLDYAARMVEPYPLLPPSTSFHLKATAGFATFSTSKTPVPGVAWPGLVLKDVILTTSSVAELAKQPSLIGTLVGSYEILAPWGVVATTPLTFSSLSTPGSATTTTTSALGPPAG
jgi:serine-type D-Ala-D-Ala carboxypeptidase (penicillin-binding protein 5/6)